MNDIQPGHYAKKQLLSPSGLVRWSHGSRFRLARQLVAPFAGRHLLDYGGGDGTFLDQVQDLFPAAVGVDVAADQLVDCVVRFVGAPGRNIRNQRLTTLVADGILERVPYQDNPPRSSYRLTEKGRDLWHVLTAMRQWGDRWAAPDGPPLKMRHATCGRVVKAVPMCSHCGEPNED